MAGTVLTQEDFNRGGDPKPDTSSQTFTSDQKLDQDGKPIAEEPKEKETPVDEGGGKEPLPKPSEEPKKFKYKSQEEAESAYGEAERKMHDATTRASTLQKELDQFRKPPEPKLPTLDLEIETIADEALKGINALPWDRNEEGNPIPSPKRDRDAAIIWAKAQRRISKLEIDEVNKQNESERQIVVKTYERATKEGIGATSERPTPSERAKSDAELRILGHEFSKTDPRLATDQRIDQAIENTKSLLSGIREGFEEKIEKDKKEKDDLKVLGRGSSRREVKKEDESKPVTMSQQLAQIAEQRRLGKDDLRSY